MKEIMPDISFERSMNHNYMILSRCDFFDRGNNKDEDYRTKMLLENHIPGLLPVTHRWINGESRYYYEINSLQSLDRLYGKSEIGYEELRCLLSGCVNLFERLEEYLLDGTQIIIKPQFIYIDIDKMNPNFVCYPEYEGDARLSFMEFVDELLTKIDHTDERAVMLGYQVYRYTRNPNYVMSEIGHMMEHVIVNMVHKAASQQEYLEHSQWSRNSHCDKNNQNIKLAGCQPEQGLESDSLDQYVCSGSEHCDDAYDKHGESHSVRAKNIGDLVGGIFCAFISLCTGAVILGARLIKSVELSGNNELYLCGAMGMAVMAAVLFFYCYLKKGRQDKEVESISEDNGQEDYMYYSQPCCSAPDLDQAGKQEEDFCYGNARLDLCYDPHQDLYHSICPETVYLGDGAVEERVLCGRVNGREVNVSLDKLPMTVGKHANMVDFVINDAAVSKMHARFEEHDGRVYVCDLNSTNGTVRNGVLLGVNQSVPLEPGDRLRFGKTCFTYC